MTRLVLDNASARLGGRLVLDGVSMAAGQGELIAVVGPNGAGKSSLLRALAGLLPLPSGRAMADGHPVHVLPPRTRAERLGYLPQDRRIAWNLPAVEVAALGAPFLSGDEARDRAFQALRAVEAAHLADRGAADMSGGERARVLLARVLATRAHSLLLDEPVDGLDPDAQLMVLDALRGLAAAGQTILFSLHDLSLARTADRVLVISEGRIAADGPPSEALAPDILHQVFGLDGVWLETDGRAVLAARRYSPGSGGGAVSPVSPVP